jgi:pyruvate dehydrogenase E2 component (dihydrolipoamide acetyltransferase)
MFRVAVPQLFENMEEATIGSWLRSEGDSIEVGTPLCELITEKTTLELPSESAGILRKIAVPAKAVVPAGTIIALVGDAAEELPDIEAENAAIGAKKAPSNSLETPALSVPSLGIPTATPGGGSRLRATPAARRAAKEAGVSIEDVAAKFPGKVLGEEDVKAFATA